MTAPALVRLLEAAVSGALSPEEKDRAHAALAALPVHQEYGWGDTVSTRDVGFARPETLVVWDMRDADERHLRPVEVDPRTLRYTQTGVPVAGIRAYIDGVGIVTGDAAARWAELPAVIQHEGHSYVYSGHTRLSAQMLAGRETVRVNVCSWARPAPGAKGRFGPPR